MSWADDMDRAMEANPEQFGMVLDDRGNPVDAQPVEPLTAEQLRSTVAIARGRVDALLQGRGEWVIWQRLAEDLDAIAVTLDAARAGDGLLRERLLRWADEHAFYLDIGTGTDPHVVNYDDLIAALAVEGSER